jgi:hypothetical protein
MSQGPALARDTCDRLPTALAWTRALLFVTAALTALTTLGYVAANGASPESLGRVVWASWPGLLGLVVAIRLRRPDRGRFWLVVVAQAALVLMALAALGRGEARGLTSLLLPVTTLLLVTRPSSRAFLRD